MQKTSEWELMKQGQFELAYTKLTDHIKDNPNNIFRYIYNRGLCLLNLGGIDQALSDFQTIIKLRPSSDSGYIGAGIALWWKDQKSEAVQTWENALDSTYTDAAGGVTVPALLFFAASRMVDLDLEKFSLQLLKVKSRTKQAYVWPGPIAKFLLGNITEAELLEETHKRTALKTRMLTKAHFWIGLLEYRQNNIDSYVSHLNLAISGHLLEPEYYLAKIELRSFHERS